MKSVLPIICLFLLQTLAAQEQITITLKEDPELKGWTESQPPEFYSGEDLFFYIDGGADIFLEYGFVEVSSYHYTDSEGRAVHAELYQMKDAGAAYGIYSINKPEKSIEYNIGYEGYTHNYFMAYFKNDFYVILSSESIEKNAIEGMKKIGHAFEKGITGETILPEIVIKYSDVEKATEFKYLRGNVAMSNIHFFSAVNVFQIKEGLSFKKNGMLILLFNYDDITASGNAFKSGLNFFSTSNKFNLLGQKEDNISLNDSKANRIEVSLKNSMMFIFIAPNDAFDQNLVDQIVSF